MAGKVYLFKGDEKYLTNTKIQRLIKESKADEFNITTYDCSEVNVEQAIFDACTPAFLGGNKVIIIKNPAFLETEKSSHNVKIMMNYLDNPIEETYLIINATKTKINEKTDIVKALNKKAIVVNTNGISEVEFTGWLTRECETQGVRIDKNAIALFYKTIGVNLEQAKNEVDKIINYVDQGGVITESITKELLCKGTQNDIFALTNAIFEKDKVKIINVYNELTRYEKDVSVLINLITKSFKDILLVKILASNGLDQNEVASKMKVSPNRAYHMLKNASAFSIEIIKKYICSLAELDYKIKSGLIDKKIGFEQFLLSL